MRNELKRCGKKLNVVLVLARTAVLNNVSNAEFKMGKPYFLYKNQPIHMRLRDGLILFAGYLFLVAILETEFPSANSERFLNFCVSMFTAYALAYLLHVTLSMPSEVERDKGLIGMLKNLAERMAICQDLLDGNLCCSRYREWNKKNDDVFYFYRHCGGCNEKDSTQCMVLNPYITAITIPGDFDLFKNICSATHINMFKYIDAISEGTDLFYNAYTLQKFPRSKLIQLYVAYMHFFDNLKDYYQDGHQLFKDYCKVSKSALNQ